jgi:hypothetical protein
MHKVQREFKTRIKGRTESAWVYITQLGMKNGWYAYGHFFKKRYSPVIVRKKLSAGDMLDFFKIESVEEGRSVTLAAETPFMSINFEITLEQETVDTALMTLSTRMDISNFIGSLYWLFIQVPDELLQRMMMNNIKRYVEARE